MTYTERDSASAVSVRKLAEVIALALADGFTLADQSDRSEHARHDWQTIAKDGAHFTLSTGGWREENHITCRLADIKDPSKPGGRIHAGDVQPYNARIDTQARASASREAAALWKTFKTRVISRQDVQEVAAKMQAEAVKRVAERNTMDSICKAMEAHGYTARAEDNSGYCRQAWRSSYEDSDAKSWPHTIKIYRDHLTAEINTTPEKYARILAILAE